MAEAAGLALSGIALVGLFSTCIELVEYYEQIENWAQDFQLVLTKLSLMKERLSQWGATMSIDCPGAEAKAKALRDRWPAESGVIMETLTGIKDILSDTTHMCGRYTNPCSSHAQPRPHPLRKGIKKDAFGDTTSSRSYPTSSYMYPCCDKAASFPQSCVRGTLRTVRLKAVWVIQDRKRFQRLITDFDFLLSNLEKIGDRLQKESTMPGQVVHSSVQTNGGMVFPHLETSNQLIDVDGFQSSDTTSAESIRQLNLNDLKCSETFSKDGHTYLENGACDDADMNMGNFYLNGIAQSSGRRHVYIRNKAKGHGTMWLGDTDGETALRVLSEKRKWRAEERLAEKAMERAEKRLAEEATERAEEGLAEKAAERAQRAIEREAGRKTGLG